MGGRAMRGSCGAGGGWLASHPKTSWKEMSITEKEFVVQAELWNRNFRVTALSPRHNKHGFRNMLEVARSRFSDLNGCWPKTGTRDREGICHFLWTIMPSCLLLKSLKFLISWWIWGQVWVFILWYSNRVTLGILLKFSELQLFLYVK